MEKKYIPNIDASTGQRIDRSKPHYRLTAPACNNDRLLDPDTRPVGPASDTEARFPMLIAFDGVPGPHMEPMNKLAEEVVKKHFPDGRVNVDPITSLAAI